MTSIGFATRDWSTDFLDHRGYPTIGGSGWYRCALPAKALASEFDLGPSGAFEPRHRVVVGTLVGHPLSDELGVRTWDGQIHSGLDVLVLQRWMRCDVPDKVRRAVAWGQRVISDVDDWWDGLDPAHRAHWTTDPLRFPLENRNHLRATFSSSTLLTCSTPFLESNYRRLAPTTLVRNAIDVDAWSFEPSSARTVGWIGGIPWRCSGDLPVLRPFLRRWLDDHPGWSAVHGGDLPDARHPGGARLPTFAEATGVGEAEVERRPLVPVPRYPSLFRRIGVLLVPLVDLPFNHAKSCLRGMEAAAAGVPFVASATPDYRWLAREHGIGRVAASPREWVRHLDELADPEVRAAEAKANRERVGALGLPSLASTCEAVIGGSPVREGARDTIGG